MFVTLRVTTLIWMSITTLITVPTILSTTMHDYCRQRREGVVDLYSSPPVPNSSAILNTGSADNFTDICDCIYLLDIRTITNPLLWPHMVLSKHIYTGHFDIPFPPHEARLYLIFITAVLSCVIIAAMTITWSLTKVSSYTLHQNVSL